MNTSSCCPVSNKLGATPGGDGAAPALSNQPVWQNDISVLFSAPYWLPEKEQAEVAAQWQGCMSGFGLQLNVYEGVKAQAVTIYHMLHSREMPLTQDQRQFWPDAALECLRHWVNQGCREVISDPIAQHEVIAPPLLRPWAIRMRRDIRSLSQSELDDYRMRLDDVMQVSSFDPNAKAQIYAAIHSDWCLHYQEAFLLWHRAYLLQFELQLGCTVPYWNWMAEDASVDGTPDAGIPQAFKDETYVHTLTKEVRKNPLRYAVARGACSKACASGITPPGIDCRYVQRDPLLYTSGDDHRAERSAKIAMTRIFQEQVVQALRWDTFSQPQGYPGYPWANITEFNPPQPDSLYPHRTDFDGLYEQPHDNYHGWIGADMADNAYTAYDPIFWSYHANIDRMFEVWIRAHPAALFSANVPLHPFVGTRAEHIDLDDPRRFVYTSIGDMCKDSRSLGFDYAPPVSPDFQGTAQERLKSSLDTSPPESSPAHGAYVLFNGIRCTMDSYSIDVFANLDASTSSPDTLLQTIRLDNPHYIGRLSRIGMGLVDDKGRCIQHGVTRVLDASAHAQALALQPNTPVAITLLVRDLATGRILPSEEYAKLPGFQPEWVWGRSWKSNIKTATRTCCPMKLMHAD